MSLEEAMRTQRAIRRLKPDPVDDALVLHLVELALKAPTGSNAQSWEFVVVRDPAVKARLGTLNRRAWGLYGGVGRRLYRSDPAMMRIMDAVQWQVDHFAEIPVIVVACLRGMIPLLPRVAVSSLYGSIYPSVQNLLLAARAGARGGAHHAAALEHVAGASRARAPLDGHTVRGDPARVAPRTLRPDHAAAGRRGRARRSVRQSAVPGPRHRCCGLTAPASRTLGDAAAAFHRAARG